MTIDIQRIFDDYAETITVKEVTITVDSYGHTSESTADFTLTGIVQIMNDESEEVKASILNIGDIVACFNPDDTNIAKIALDNRIEYNSSEYKIVNIIKEMGVQRGESVSHYEVHGRRIK